MEYKDHNVYPSLPATAPGGESYRLQKINEIQKEIAIERDKRANLSENYYRAVKVIAVVDAALVVSSMGLGAAGIGVLSTIIAAPVAIAMESVALGAGLLSMVGGQTNKKLNRKAEKHEKIKTLADAKLNTISGLISKALVDDRISDEEYSIILNELNSFIQIREEIKSKVKVGIDEEKERGDVIASFQNMFNKSRSRVV
jgi:hypothetical protein